jgi:hypothetical protein
MAKRLRNKDGHVLAIELEVEEMANALGIEVEDLMEWQISIPPYSQEHGKITYRISDMQEINRWKKRVALLRTRMSEKAVINVEEAGLLDAYAALAEDCPAGITAHVWRSYALVVLLQTRYGKMVDAKELAERARLTKTDPATGKEVVDVEMAKKHLRLLQGLGQLRIGEGKWEGEWFHKGLPRSWRF